MVFLFERIQNGVCHKLGIVVADSPQKAAEKLGVELAGHLSKWDGRRAFYVEQGNSSEPQYILEHWGELEGFPQEEFEQEHLVRVKKERIIPHPRCEY